MTAAPWFYSVPILPWNGGQKTEREFEQDRDRDRIVITGWDPGALAQCDVFTISEFEYRDGARLRKPETTDFIAALSDQYHSLDVFGARTLPIPFPFRRDQAPHDYLYAAPEVRVYHGLDVGRG
jgi:hypothetical protein